MSEWTGIKILGFLVPTIAAILGLAQIGVWPNGWFPIELIGKSELSHPKIYSLSNDPVVVYVKDFISTEEAAYLVSLA